MKFSTLFAVATTAALFSTSGAAKSKKPSRTFAVVYFGGGKELTRCRLDPVVNPGGVAGHQHSILGGDAFAASMPGDHAKTAKCTTAKVKNDHSNYWFPSLYFKDPKAGTLTPVEMYYAKVYYFFEATNDKIMAFPPGFRMLAGNAALRSPPSGRKTNYDPAKGPINNVEWVCPRKNDNSPLYPPTSDGTKGVGVQNQSNGGAGFGFSDKDCDGLYSPMRADIHFPSCVNPKVAADNYKENTAWPTSNGMGGEDCPPGYIHVPHLFVEVYWNTQKFSGKWTPGQGKHPWVLSNGDTTGYSLHADFVNGWDTATLQHAIDTCDTGNGGMHECPGLPGGETPEAEMKACKLQCPLAESKFDNPKDAVPMPNNKLFGTNDLVGYQNTPYVAPGGSGSMSSVPAAPKPTTTLKPQSVPIKNPVSTIPSKPQTTMVYVTKQPVPTKPVYVEYTTKKTTTVRVTKVITPTQTTTKAIHPASATSVKPKSTCTRTRKHNRHGSHRHGSH